MITIFATIIVLSVIVFVHEMGHFLMAKLGGVKVERFSIGFPPTILKKKFGETEYAIGAIPFGGYVKMAGEYREEETEPEPGELESKSVGIRAAIMAAGPAMNVILAVVLFWAVLAFHGMGEVSNKTLVGGVMEDAPADSAGVEAGDSIALVDGTSFADWQGLSTFVHDRPEEKLAFTLVRGDEIFTREITPRPREFDTDSGTIRVGLIGIQPEVSFEAAGPLAAIPASFGMFGEVLRAMKQFIAKLFGPGLDKGDLGGPVMIGKLAGASARSGWAPFLFFMAALSINLAILNLLPFPALDGGHLAFLAVEAIRRKPLSLKVRMALQQIGIILILALMVYVTVSDISTLFFG